MESSTAGSLAQALPASAAAVDAGPAALEEAAGVAGVAGVAGKRTWDRLGFIDLLAIGLICLGAEMVLVCVLYRTKRKEEKRTGRKELEYIERG